jgi:hypothetical protein
MEYRVIAKPGLRIPFRFLREGKVFDATKLHVSEASIKHWLAEGKIAEGGLPPPTAEDVPPKTNTKITKSKQGALDENIQDPV